MLYKTLRFLHLGLMSAAIPLALLYVRELYPDAFPRMSGWEITGMLIAIMFILLFHLLFHQRYFPFTTGGAAMHLVTLASNMVTASVIGTASVFFGAFTVTMRVFLIYVLYFGLQIIYFLNPQQREKRFYYTENTYLILLLLFFIVALIMIVILFRPMVEQYLLEENLFLISSSLLSIAVDLYWNVRQLLQHNLFQFEKGVEKEKRDKALEQWAIPFFICMMLSLAACFTIVCWERL